MDLSNCWALWDFLWGACSIKIVYLLSSRRRPIQINRIETRASTNLFFWRSLNHIFPWFIVWSSNWQRSSTASKINIHLKMVLQGIHFKPLERNGAGKRLWLPFGKNAMIIRGFSSIQSQSMKNCKWISTSILAITIITARSQLLKRIYYYTLSRQKSVVV